MYRVVTGNVPARSAADAFSDALVPVLIPTLG